MEGIQLHHSPVFAPKFKIRGTNLTNVFHVQQADGTAVFNVDTTNARVGIGTATPTSTLDVRGPISVFRDITGTGILDDFFTHSLTTSFFQIDAGVYYGVVSLAAGNNEYCVWQEYAKTRSTDGNTYAVVQENDELGRFNFKGDGGDTLDSGASIRVNVDGTPGIGDMPGRISFWTTPDGSNSAVQRLTIKNSGRVGIGTAAPSTTLDVAGNVLFKNTADSTTAFQIQQADTTPVFNVDTTNGRVGIGTATPTTTLHLLSADTALPDLRLENTTQSTTSSVISFVKDSATALIGTRLGYITFQGDNDNNNVVEYANIAGYSNTGVAGSEGGRLIFKVDNAGSSTSVFDFQGTTSGAGSIVFGKSGSDFDIKFNTAVVANTLVIDGGTGGLTHTGGSDTVQLTLKANATQTANILEIQDSAGNADIFVIDGSERVGIGTTTPGAALDISDGYMTIKVGADNVARTRTDATNKYSRLGSAHYTNAEEPVGLILGYSASDENLVGIGGGNNLLNAATNIRFYTAATTTTVTGTERMRIDGSGNVLIGPVGAPTAHLHVKGIADDQQLTVQANAAQTANLLEIQNSSNDVLSGVDERGILFSHGVTAPASNFFAGSGAGNVATTGLQNVAVGVNALDKVTTGNNNMAVGGLALTDLTTGLGNLGIGYSALANVIDGDYNVGLGRSAGLALTTGDRNIFIGMQAGDKQTTASNLLIIDNQTRADVATELTNSILYGVMGAAPASQSLRVNANLTSTQGRIKNTTRATTTYTILVTDDVIFANTDGAAWTATLPAGVEGQTFKIINSGSSANNLTVAPDGSEHLIGANSNFTLTDGETLVITYNSTDGWY